MINRPLKLSLDFQSFSTGLKRYKPKLLFGYSVPLQSERKAIEKPYKQDVKHKIHALGFDRAEPVRQTLPAPRGSRKISIGLSFLLSFFSISTLASLCEKRAFSPPERALRIFEYYENQVNNRGRINVDIDLSHFKDDQNVRHGNANTFITTGYMREKLFLKEINPINNRGTQELAVFRTLQELKIPTLFKGVGRMTSNPVTGDLEPYKPFLKGHEDGTMHFMVSRWQKGKDWVADQMNNRGPRSLDNINSLTHKGIEELKKVFLKYHIIPSDLQLLISESGKPHIIDPEFFEFMGGRPEEVLNGHWKDAEDMAHLLVPENLEFMQRLKRFMTKDKTYEDLINFYFEQMAWPGKEYKGPTRETETASTRFAIF